MDVSTVKDQTELSEVTRPILSQEDGASSKFPIIVNDTINNPESEYKTECDQKASDQITENMTIDTQSAEDGLIRSKPEESEILKEDRQEKMPDQITANLALETPSAEGRLNIGHSEDSEIPEKDIKETENILKNGTHGGDIKVRKHVEDAPLTFVDEDDGLMKLLGKACGVRKEKLTDEDMKPYTKAASGKYKAMGRTPSEECGFDDAKLNEIHLNFEKRVGERLAYQDDKTVGLTETERAKLDEKRAHFNLHSKETNVSGDVRGHVTHEKETQEGKQRLYMKHLEPRPENVQTPNQTITASRSHKGQRSHNTTPGKYEDVYNFDHPQRGFMLTIVNDQFARQTPRDGAQWDLLKMKEIARKFGFRSLNPNQEMNQTKEQILRWLSLARRMDHSQCDCFMFMISTHGLEQKNALKGGQVDHALVCADDQLIFTSTILEMFNDTNCPTLKGKPKIFYIQACRGEKLDHGGKMFVATQSNEDKTCGVSNEEWTDRKGRESLDESDTNYGEDSWAFHHKYGAGGYTGSQASSSTSHHSAPSRNHNTTHHTASSSSSHVSGHPPSSSQISQASSIGQQHAAFHPSSSRTYSAQVPNAQRPSFMVPKVSQSTQPQYQSHLHRSKILHAPGHMVSKIYAPTPYAIVDIPSLKCDNDMMIMYAIPPGMFAWRNTSEGSWMIDYLYTVLMAYNMKRPKNFLNLMTKVSALMSRRTTNTPSAPAMHEKKAVSVIEHKLVKDIFFKQKGPGSDWVKKSKMVAL